MQRVFVNRWTPGLGNVLLVDRSSKCVKQCLDAIIDVALGCDDSFRRFRPEHQNVQLSSKRSNVDATIDVKLYPATLLGFGPLAS